MAFQGPRRAAVNVVTCFALNPVVVTNMGDLKIEQVNICLGEQ